MKTYCLSNILINSSEPLFLLNEVAAENNPDIYINWYSNLEESFVNGLYNDCDYESEVAASTSFNNVIPKAKISKKQKAIYYKNQVLFYITYNDALNDTNACVVVNVYICNGFSINLSKEILLTDALPLAIFMKSHWFFIHGACISFNGKHIVILGDGGAGKSTLSSFLYFNGCDLISDDMICIKEKNGTIYTTAYVNYLRVWRDSYSYMTDDLPNAVTYNGKYIIKTKEQNRNWIQIDGCYWLNRGHLNTEIRAMNSMEGYIQLIRSLIMGFAYEKKEVDLISKRLLNLARTSSLFKLNYCNGYETLSDVILAIRESLL